MQQDKLWCQIMRDQPEILSDNVEVLEWLVRRISLHHIQFNSKLEVREYSWTSFKQPLLGKVQVAV